MRNVVDVRSAESTRQALEACTTLSEVYALFGRRRPIDPNTAAKGAGVIGLMIWSGLSLTPIGAARWFTPASAVVICTGVLAAGVAALLWSKLRPPSPKLRNALAYWKHHHDTAGHEAALRSLRAGESRVSAEFDAAWGKTG